MPPCAVAQSPAILALRNVTWGTASIAYRPEGFVQEDTALLLGRIAQMNAPFLAIRARKNVSPALTDKRVAKGQIINIAHQALKAAPASPIPPSAVQIAQQTAIHAPKGAQMAHAKATATGDVGAENASVPEATAHQPVVAFLP